MGKPLSQKHILRTKVVSPSCRCVWWKEYLIPKIRWSNTCPFFSHSLYNRCIGVDNSPLKNWWGSMSMRLDLKKNLSYVHRCSQAPQISHTFHGLKKKSEAAAALKKTRHLFFCCIQWSLSPWMTESSQYPLICMNSNLIKKCSKQWIGL